MVGVTQTERAHDELGMVQFDLFADCVGEATRIFSWPVLLVEEVEVHWCCVEQGECGFVLGYALLNCVPRVGESASAYVPVLCLWRVGSTGEHGHDDRATPSRKELAGGVDRVIEVGRDNQNSRH